MFELPKLPYDRTALEPYLSAETIDYHYGKHHAAYVKNLNNLVAGTPFENMLLEEVVKTAEDKGILNNSIQILNHTFYWESLGLKKGDPTGKLLNAINRNFGSFEAFKNQFTKAAVTLFGSGWAWLSTNSQGELIISQLSNADTPLRYGLKPLLTCDVWEHAYYIDYHNDRSKYVEMFWNIVNWETVEKRFETFCQ